VRKAPTKGESAGGLVAGEEKTRAGRLMETTVSLWLFPLEPPLLDPRSDGGVIIIG